jgi:hypothetical protein
MVRRENAFDGCLIGGAYLSVCRIRETKKPPAGGYYSKR